MLRRIINGMSFDGHYGYIASASVAGNFGDALISVDLDGDGYDELVSGTPNGFGDPDPTHFSYPSPGYVGITWGGPSVFPASFDFLNYTRDENCRGFYIKGGGCDQAVGFSLGAGDVDGDGISDLAMITNSNCDMPLDVYVLRGGSRAQFTTMTLDQFSTNPSRYGYKFTGLPPYDNVFVNVADVNNDKIADIILSNTKKERVDIIWGRLNGFPSVTSIPDLTSPEISTIMGPGLVAENGYSSPGFFGSSVAVGDVNGDKKNELYITAPYGGDNGSGIVYGFTSFPALQNATESEFKIGCEATDTNHLGFGQGIGVGDITNDQIDDLIICGRAQASQTQTSTFSGSYCVAIFGKPMLTLPTNVTNLSSTDGLYIVKDDGCIGEVNRMAFFDINDDGINDLALGDYCAEKFPTTEQYASPFINNGSVVFIFGQDATQTAFPLFFNASQIAEKDGGVWKGTEYKALSYAMTIGDFNGDGKQDIAASTPFLLDSSYKQSVYVAMSSALNESAPVCMASTPSVLKPSPEPKPERVPTSTSAANRVTPFFNAYTAQVSTSVKNAAIHGGVSSLSKTINYALEVKGYSSVTGFVAKNVVYYSGMYALNFYQRYNELATNHDIPEAEKSTTAAYQALADVGTLAATKAVLSIGSAVCNFLGRVAESKGFTRVSDNLSWLSGAIDDCAYAYQSRHQGVLPGAASILGGVYIEKTATVVGKKLVDNYVTPIQPDAYKKANKSKVMLFSAPTPQDAALAKRQVATKSHRFNG